MAKYGLYRSVRPGGIEVAVALPSDGLTVKDDFDTALAAVVEMVGPARVLRAFEQQIVYHGILGAVRSATSDALDDRATDEAGKRIVEKDSKGKVVNVEQDEPYAKRLVDTGQITVEELASVMADIVSDAEFAFAEFAKEPERKPRAPKKLPKDIQAFVAEWAKTGELATKVANLAAKGYTVSDPTNLDQVGWAVHAFRLDQQRAILNQV